MRTTRTEWGKRAAIWVALCLPGFGCSGGGNAAEKDQSTILQVLPDLASAGAPDSIKVGTRLTYHWASASIAGYGPDWILDEEGKFKNTKTGKSYTEQRKEGGGSGFGLSDWTVAAIDGNNCAIQVVSFSQQIDGGAPAVMARTVQLGTAGTGGGLWANPSELRKLGNQFSELLTVCRQPYKIGEKSFNAVWIGSRTEVSSNLLIFDEETGILLHYNQATNAADTQTKGPDDMGKRTGGCLMSEGTLLGITTPNIPWANEPVPDWVKHTKSFSYSGKSDISGVTMFGDLTMTTADQGERWLLSNGSMTVRYNTSEPSTSTFQIVSSSVVIGGMYIPASGLAQLRQGQVIDENPITQIVSRVEGVSQGPKGPMVVISSGNAASGFRYGYDQATGMLVMVGQKGNNMASDSNLFLTAAN